MTDVSSPSAAQPALPAPASREWPAWVALLCSAVAMAGVGVGYWQNAKHQQTVLTRYAEMHALANQAKRNADETLTQVQALQGRLVVAEERLADVALQRGQLEELIRSVSRSRDDGLIQDIESALRLAQQQVQLTGSVQPLITVMQATSQRIAKSSQPRLNAVQRAIDRDLERIQQATLLDVPGLADRLDEMILAVDALQPLGAQPIKATPTSVTTVAAASDAPTDAAVPWWQQASHRLQVWLMGALAKFQAGARDLVRISEIDHPEAVLMSPEQHFFLKQNIKMQLLNARLGLLSRHLDVARADVVQVKATLGRYFDVTSGKPALMFKGLELVVQDLTHAEPPRIEETLRALNAAAEGL